MSKALLAYAGRPTFGFRPIIMSLAAKGTVAKFKRTAKDTECLHTYFFKKNGQSHVIFIYPSNCQQRLNSTQPASIFVREFSLDRQTNQN